jgi:PAS domain S-box-containing protein
MREPSTEITATTEQLLDSSPDGVLIVGTDGLIRLANRQAEALFGYDRDELVGLQTALLLPVRDRPDLDGHRAAYYRNPTVGAALEIAAVRKDGCEFPLDASFSLLETDDGQFVYASVRDSSVRKTIEARTESFDATSQMAAIVESSEDAIIGKTLDGVITTWNSGAQQMYGFGPEEIIGHNISELMPGDRVEELAPILERVRRGERVEHKETKRVRQDGSIIDVSVTISPIRDAAGVVTGASTVARDLTEVRKAETERRDLEDRLRQSERLESLGQLAGGVAHDFNNLLAGIMNYAALVSDSLSDSMSRLGLSDDEALVTVVRDVDEITGVAKRAAALTHQLLVFSRREVVRKEALDLNAIAGELEALLRTTVPENVELRMLLAPDLPLVNADRSQIDQVFMNLAVNARDAMPDGGALEIETATFEVDAQYARVAKIEPGLYVRLTVSDTGTGMSREVLGRTFEPFFTTKPKGVGSGLGLATVYGIVTQAGGDVTIYSEPGIGTAVRVNLPVTSDPASSPLVAPPDVPLSANGETVLLVEDEEIVREPTRRILERRGYTVLAAGDAAEAMTIVREHSGTIDLLLTDLVMPGHSGRDLAAEVLEHSSVTRVLFMSGYSQDLMFHQGVLEEGVRLITKPFSANDLLRTVRAALDGGS